jgi:protein ImuB
MPRILSVWLERWPIRRFLLAQDRNPPFGAPVDPAKPFVLSVDASGGPRIAALNEAAEAQGVAAGEGLADARAKAATLQIRALDAAADAAALRRLARWATRYTPSVAPWSVENGADGLFLEVAGAAHLLGGEAGLVADLQRRLAGFGLPARLALADTPGAGWALARFGASPTALVASGAEAAALAKLPVEALRLDPATCLTLRRLGLKTVGDLLDKPRAPLSRRFGAQMLLRLDQALGRIAEPLNFLAPLPAYAAARQFLDPVVSQPGVAAIGRKLFEDLRPQLERNGVGARSLRLSLYRVDGEAFPVEIGLAAPTRNASYVKRQLELRLDRLAGTIDPGFGFETIRLDVTATERMAEEQATFHPSSDGPEPAGRSVAFIDALWQRFGRTSVRRLWAVESHIPERAAAAREETGRTPDWSFDGELPCRPTLLLRAAEPAEVLAVVPEGPPRRFRWRGAMHRVAHAQGPERIAPEWWHRPEPQPTRDYYIVEDETGRRFWLFREGLYGRETGEPRWFVHGFFA